MAGAGKASSKERSQFNMDVHIMNDDAALMKTESDTLVRAVCAALNSDQREVLKLRNEDREKQGVTRKHLDKWKKNIEGELFKSLKPLQWQKCFDFCRQSPGAEYLYIYTTPTSPSTTVSYNLRLPTDTSTELVEKYHQVMSVLSRRDKRTMDRPYFDFDEHLSKAEEPKLTDAASTSVIGDAQGSNTHFQRLEDLGMGDIVSIPESKTVQYKKLKDGKGLVLNIERNVSDYFGAFANHEGGWIVIGIEDSNCAVVGQTIESEETKGDILQYLDMCAKRKVWGKRQETPVRGRHWDVYFHPLGEDRYLIEVRVNPFDDGVFQKVPESYTFEVNDDGEKVVAQMKFEVWIKAMMREKMTEQRRSEEMREKFDMLSTHISGGCKVFALKNSHREIQERMFAIKEGLHIWPETYDNLVPHTATCFLQNVITALKARFKTTKGVCVISHCILADIGILRPQYAKGLVCDILVFTETETPFLLTLGSSNESEEYVKKAAVELEECLTGHGGEGRFFIKSCWCDLSTDSECIPGILESILGHHPSDKPASYHQMHPWKLQAIVSGLVIAIAAFTPETYLYMRDLMGVQVMNLFTPSQLLALTTCKNVPFVCIQGYPGTGKTVVGIERAKQLRLDGAEVEEILYIPSNVQMATFVRGLTFSKNSSLHGSKICLSEAFKEVIQMLKDGTMPETVKYLILDDTQNLLSRRNVPAKSFEEDIRFLTPEMRRLAVKKEDIGLLRLESYQVDWMRCLCLWLRMKEEGRMVVICDESQSLERKHYYETIREFIKETSGTTVTLNVVIRNSEEITDFFKQFVSTKCYGVLPTTAHDFKGQRPVMRPTLLSPQSMRQTIGKYTAMGYTPSEISLIRHDLDSDKTALDICMTTPLQKECMTVYRDINEVLIEQGVGNNGVPLPQVFHAVLFFCLLTEEILVGHVDADQDPNFKINIASSCFAGNDTATPPVFLQKLLSDRGRYAAPVRDTVVRLFEEKWQYLCELYKKVVLHGRPISTDTVADILEERKVHLLCVGVKEMTNLQKLYSVSNFLLKPVTVSEHIFRIVDVQHAGFYRLIIFHILPNVHAIHGTHEVPARGQCIRIESLESFTGRENQVVIGIMPNEDTLKRYTFENYTAALASRARTKLEILSLNVCFLGTSLSGDALRIIKKHFVEDE